MFSVSNVGHMYTFEIWYCLIL